MNQENKRRIIARWEPPSPAAEASTADRLIEGTLQSLGRYGLQGTTSRAIVAAAGVNLGAITYHFGSKDELIAQALLQTIKSWVEPALKVLRQDIDPAARLLAAIDQLRTTFADARDMLPVYLEALLAASRNETLRHGVDELMTEVRGFLAAQLTDQRDGGYLPAWVDPEAMATLLMATADGLGLHAVLESDGIDVDGVGAQAVQLLLAARGSRES
jgi:AcrR family transcriptional regulator